MSGRLHLVSTVESQEIHKIQYGGFQDGRHSQEPTWRLSRWTTFTRSYMVAFKMDDIHKILYGGFQDGHHSQDPIWRLSRWTTFTRSNMAAFKMDAIHKIQNGGFQDGHHPQDPIWRLSRWTPCSGHSLKDRPPHPLLAGICYFILLFLK